jgi:tetratricopeptide (TPR) repeat protein
MWRPEVVFTERSAPRGDAPLSHLVHQMMLQAVESAGDPTRYTEQLTHAGLEPWKVRKLYTASADGHNGTTTLETSQLSPRLGQSFADYAAVARLLVDERIVPSPPVLGFRLAMNHLNGAGSERDFFSGLVLHPGGEARRMLTELPADGLEQLRRAVQKQRNIEAVLARVDEGPGQGAALAAQMGDFVQTIEGPMAGRLFYQMADRYYRSGQWDLAAETYDQLVNTYPDHPLTPPALVWLVQYWSSGEAAWRSQSRQRVSVARSDEQSSEQAAARRASALAIDETQLVDRYRRAGELGKFLESTRPVLGAEPAVRFPLAVAYRRQGLPREAERFYLALRQRNMQDVWWSCADAERWLADTRSAMPQKSVWPCYSAAGSKPRLDGRLDDAIWQRAHKAALASPLRDDAQWPAVAMVAYDEGFLYLAASCQSTASATAASDEPRPRDADLAAHDRVEFRIDLDRDYATAYRLVVDCRGWTADDLWHDSSWNPTWFVAAHRDAGVWNIEAAIPLEELTNQFPAAKSVWAIGVQRIAPELGFQPWTTPASATGNTAGLGLLLFE